MPVDICQWNKINNKYFIHCSTQGVFDGESSPYSPMDIPKPITEYGKQKYLSEKMVLSYENTEVDRLTFVIGIRPFQNIGRKNPLEEMIEKENQLQVNDRFFSPLFAEEAADILWERALGNNRNSDRIVHLGTPIKCSRYTIASDLKYNSHGNIKASIQPVSHEHFPGIAPRPKNTTWEFGKCLYKNRYDDALLNAYIQWNRMNGI